jgi:hypothetical protein
MRPAAQTRQAAGKTRIKNGFASVTHPIGTAAMVRRSLGGEFYLQFYFLSFAYALHRRGGRTALSLRHGQCACRRCECGTLAAQRTLILDIVRCRG